MDRVSGRMLSAKFKAHLTEPSFGASDMMLKISFELFRRHSYVAIDKSQCPKMAQHTLFNKLAVMLLN